MTRLVDEILRVEIERRCSQEDPHTGSGNPESLKKNS
jgi:hypothetical protein